MNPCPVCNSPIHVIGTKWVKRGNRASGYEWVVESFDVVEQPSRYKLAERCEAFRYRTFEDKNNAYLSRKAAIEATLSSLRSDLDAARMEVAALEDSIAQVSKL